MGNQYSLIANINISLMYFTMNQYTRANALFKEILSQELQYVDNNKFHPFMEQIYLHLAIMYDNLEEYNSSYVMWKSLLKVHKNEYDLNSNYISKDYFYISKCHIQLGEIDKALYNVFKPLLLTFYSLK